VGATDRPRILIVEDDPDQFDALAFALDSAGYAIEHARDGSEALAVLARFQPAVVLTDLVMPGMSGEEMIRAIRRGPGPQPRVVLVSGLDGLDARARAVGADGYLVKPFDLDTLLNAVAKHVARAGGSESAGASRQSTR
jgi:DNA-binding response OmpR family regulator